MAMYDKTCEKADLSPRDEEIEQVRSRIRAREAALSKNVQDLADTATHKIQAIKSSLHLESRIREHPTLSLLASVAAGFVASRLRQRPPRSTILNVRAKQQIESEQASKDAALTLLGGLLLPVGMHLMRSTAYHFIDSHFQPNPSAEKSAQVTPAGSNREKVQTVGKKTSEVVRN